MLAAEQRLRRRGEFAATIKSGRRAGRGVLVVYVDLSGAAGEEMGTARVGLVVGRAVGGAVDRNRVRRRLRHLARTRLGDLPRGTNVVIRALPGAAGCPYRQLGADFDAALAAARRRRGPQPLDGLRGREGGDHP